MATYTIGQSLRVSVTFQVSGVNSDPSVITFRLKDPSGGKTAYVFGTDAAVQKDGTGLYHIDITPQLGGTYAYRWEGIGTENSATESTLSVLGSAFY